ncbi:MAG TPA: ribosome-associated translation inhibitor RaiA [Clostridiales bacterium]|nr:ribosome-associated translation inhibitor RaiA [Clostridia bacterium]HCS73483.1 ribosome-associated translation inhibitor RaiA [Clostridiales bacterium]
MRITISGKNIDITQALRNQVNKKVGKLERYFRPGTEAQVTLSTERNKYIVEVTIPFNGVLIRAEESTESMYASIDMVLDKLERQIHKYRTKLERNFRTGAFADEKMEFSQAATKGDLDDYELQIVRTKRFAVKPMSIEEALMQMDLLGHSFFVFSNSDTDEVNVVYKRHDGKYGLIEPNYS